MIRRNRFTITTPLTERFFLVYDLTFQGRRKRVENLRYILGINDVNTSRTYRV